MKITSIEIQNFKAFKDVQPFPIDGKHVLVFGNNGSGKSSFFYALHVFLQSSIKTPENRQKYFTIEGSESLLNIHAPLDLNSYIHVTLDNGNTYEFSSTPSAGKIINTEDIIKLTNDSSDFMNYKFMFAFSNFRNSEEADIFPIIRNEFFPFWVNEALTKSYQEWYEELLIEIKNQKIRYESANKGAKIAFWSKNSSFSQYKRQLENFNAALKEKTLSYLETINDLMRDHFLKDDGIKLYFDDDSFTPLKVMDNSWSGVWHIVEPKILMKIKKDGKSIAKPHVFLNEARLTGIALSIRMAIFDQRYKGAGDFKTLMLDDLLLSLDMSKRMEVINYILTNENFNNYQLFILTHDKGFYSILKNNLAKNDDDWRFFEFYENHNSSAYKNPIVLSSIDSLIKAERLLKGDPEKGIQPKLDECALYLRKKVEELIKIFYDPSLDNLSRFEVLEKLANSLKGIEKEYYNKQISNFNNLFENDNLKIENIRRLKSDPYINDSISREEVIAINILKFKMLDCLEILCNYKEQRATIKSKLLIISDNLNELRNRILNHGAHPTLEPLFGAEMVEAIRIVKEFETELKQIMEWVQNFEKDTLKIKRG